MGLLDKISKQAHSISPYTYQKLTTKCKEGSLSYNIKSELSSTDYIPDSKLSITWNHTYIMILRNNENIYILLPGILV